MCVYSIRGTALSLTSAAVNFAVLVMTLRLYRQTVQHNKVTTPFRAMKVAEICGFVTMCCALIHYFVYSCAVHCLSNQPHSLPYVMLQLARRNLAVKAEYIAKANEVKARARRFQLQKYVARGRGQEEADEDVKYGQLQLDAEQSASKTTQPTFRPYNSDIVPDQFSSFLPPGT